jgi:hypothetical protein
MPQSYPPLEQVIAPNVPTGQAAFYLQRRPQTLRIWAMGRMDAPIKPLNIGGRLAWPTARLREICGVAQ